MINVLQIYHLVEWKYGLFMRWLLNFIACFELRLKIKILLHFVSFLFWFGDHFLCSLLSSFGRLTNIFLLDSDLFSWFFGRFAWDWVLWWILVLFAEPSRKVCHRIWIFVILCNFYRLLRILKDQGYLFRLWLNSCIFWNFLRLIVVQTVKYKLKIDLLLSLTLPSWRCLGLYYLMLSCHLGLGFPPLLFITGLVVKQKTHYLLYSLLILDKFIAWLSLYWFLFGGRLKYWFCR